MATYIQGLTQYLPQIQPFQRDFNFFANVMQKKQTEYDSGHESMNKLYGSIFYSDISRTDNQKKKEEILSAIDHDLRKVSGLDLSLSENVRQAQQVFRPFYEDQNLMKDISYTKTYQSAVQKGLSAKDCVGKDCPDVYWDGGLRLLDHQMKNFKSVSADKAMQMRNPTYVNKFNMMKEAAKAAKENNFEIVFEGPKNGYIVKEKNGPNAIAPLSDFLYQMFGDDARAIDYYGAKAQLSFYENPEETINQYELQKMKSRAKDSDDYQRMVEEKTKRQTFEKNKNVINAAENTSRADLHEVKDRRKTFQDYADEMGEAFNASPAKQSYDETLQEENVKQKTYENIKGLSDNVRNVNYFDEEGNPVAEDVIVGVVAQGMMISDISNSAKVIANNTYQQTVKGADPYTMARYNNQLQMSLASYKNQLQKDLVLFKSDNELVTSLTGGKSKKGTPELGKELTKKEEKGIRKEAREKLIKDYGESVSDDAITNAEDDAVKQAKAEKEQEYKQSIIDNMPRLERAAKKGLINSEQAEIINEVVNNTVVDEQGKVLIAPVKESKTYSYNEATIAEGVLKDPQTALGSESGKLDVVNKQGEIEQLVMTYSQRQSVINQSFIRNAGVIYGGRASIQNVKNTIGQHIAQRTLQSRQDGLNSGDGSKVAASNQVLRGIGINPDDKKYDKKPDLLVSDVQSAVNENPVAFSSYFLSDPRRDATTTGLIENYFLKKKTNIDLINQGINKELGDVESVQRLPYQPGTAENPSVPYNPYTILKIASTLGIDQAAVSTLINYQFFERMAHKQMEDYNARVKGVIEMGAQARMLTYTQGVEGEEYTPEDMYTIMRAANGRFLNDTYPTDKKYIKINDELVQQDTPSTYSSQFSRFLNDQSKKDYTDLKYLHIKTATAVSHRTYSGATYWTTPDELIKQLKKAEITDNVLNLSNLVHLDKAGLLTVKGKWYDMSEGRNKPKHTEIFERDDKGTLLRYPVNVSYKSDIIGSPAGLPKLTQAAKDAGIYYKDSQLVTDNLLVSNLLQTNIMVPDYDTRLAQQIDLYTDLQNVKDFTTAGIYKGTAASSDFAFAAQGLTATTNLANANIDELTNLRDALIEGKKTLDKNPKGINIFPGAIKGHERSVVSVYKNESFAPASLSEQEQYLEIYKTISSKEASSEINKLGVVNAPSIKQTLIANSGVPGYGIVELSLIDAGADYEKYKVISEDLYNDMSQDKKDKLKEKNVVPVPNIQLLIPHDNYTPFIQANKNIAFSTLKSGKIIGSIDKLNAEIKIESVSDKEIKYTPSYTRYYRDYSTGKIKSMQQETAEPITYQHTASKDYFSLMNEIILVQQQQSKDSWKDANNTEQ